MLAMDEFNTKFPVMLREAKKEQHEKPNDPQVEIIAWVLMPNHFHFLIRQIEEGGVAKYLQKLLTGYSMYFNKRYERSGCLFQGLTKSVLVEDDPQLLHLTRYIHLNPLDLINSSWREKGILWDDAKIFLSSFKWSNLSTFSDALVLDQLGGTRDAYMKFISEWTEKDFCFVKHSALE